MAYPTYTPPACAPHASEYLLDAADIRPHLCQARRIIRDSDNRWSPALCYEEQCTRKPAAGDDLCASCRKNMEKSAIKGFHTRWLARVTEAIPGWAHLYGTEWFNFKCRWAVGEQPGAGAYHQSIRAEILAARAKSAAAPAEPVAARIDIAGWMTGAHHSPAGLAARAAAAAAEAEA